MVRARCATAALRLGVTRRAASNRRVGCLCAAGVLCLHRVALCASLCRAAHAGCRCAILPRHAPRPQITSNRWLRGQPMGLSCCFAFAMVVCCPCAGRPVPHGALSGLVHGCRAFALWPCRFAARLAGVAGIRVQTAELPASCCFAAARCASSLVSMV